MQKFKVRIERKWIETEYFDREIEAATHEEANALAHKMAQEANADCPDDVVACKSGYPESWEVDSVDASN